jgi:hypothetical protein
MLRRSWVPVVVGLLASVAACGGDESSEPFPAGAPIDVVVLADSGGSGVADLYAAKAAEALDREIRVHDHSIGGARIDRILSGIRNDWADDVSDAEIIVFYVHPGGFDPPSFTEPCLSGGGALGYIGDPPVATSVEDWQEFGDMLDQVYDEIWELRAGRPTILRAYGVWGPWLSRYREMGIESACMAGEEALDQVRRESAEAHGAIYVSMLDVFNGPDRDQDPVEKGWIEADGTHLNAEGQVVLTDALAAVGFEVSEPPR